MLWDDFGSGKCLAAQLLPTLGHFAVFYPAARRYRLLTPVRENQ
jgi:hypothetical protein